MSRWWRTRRGAWFAIIVEFAASLHVPCGGKRLLLLRQKFLTVARLRHAIPPLQNIVLI